MGRLVYACSNPSGFKPDASKPSGLDITPGICAGMSAVWCLKMGVGLPADATLPGVTESTYLQYSYDQHAINAGRLISAFLPLARLVLVDENVWDATGKGGIGAIIQQGDGHIYFWGYPGHAIGAARRDKLFYIFNPDVGLHELASSSELKAHMETHYAAHLDKAHWWLFEVGPDPKQLKDIAPGRA